MWGLELFGLDPGKDSDLSPQTGPSGGPWPVVGSGALVGSEAWSFVALEAQALGALEAGVLGAVPSASQELVQALPDPGA